MTHEPRESGLQRPELGERLALVSKAVTVGGAPVTLMRRRPPEEEPYYYGKDLLGQPWDGEAFNEADEYVGPVDSGWRFLAEGEDEAVLRDPARAGIHTLNAVAGYDPAVLPYVDFPVGVVLERRGAGFQIVTPPSLSAQADRWYSLRHALVAWVFLTVSLVGAMPPLLAWGGVILGGFGALAFTPGALRPLRLRANEDGLELPRRFAPGTIRLSWMDIAEVLVFANMLVIRFRKGYRPPTLLMRVTARFSWWKGAVLISAWPDFELGPQLESLRIAAHARAAGAARRP